ncbi:hypothetical protein COOONC_21024 [Cooperia oncophora]
MCKNSKMLWSGEKDNAVQRKEIVAKKKQLKRLYDACHVELKKKKLSKKHNKDNKDNKEKEKEKDDETKPVRLLKKRSRLNEKIEESNERKRTAPIQTKVLQEVSAALTSSKSNRINTEGPRKKMEDTVTQ